MKSLILVFLSVVFLGCSSEQKKEPYELVLTDSGVNMLKKDSSYKELDGLFLGFDVKGFSALGDGVLERVKFVALGDKEYMIVYPTSSQNEIKKVTFRNDNVKKRYLIGTSKQQLLDDKLECKKIDEVTSCIDSNEPHIKYFLKDDKLFEVVWETLK